MSRSIHSKLQIFIGFIVLSLALVAYLFGGSPRGEEAGVLSKIDEERSTIRSVKSSHRVRTSLRTQRENSRPAVLQVKSEDPEEIKDLIHQHCLNSDLRAKLLERSDHIIGLKILSSENPLKQLGESGKPTDSGSRFRLPEYYGGSFPVRLHLPKTKRADGISVGQIDGYSDFSVLAKMTASGSEIQINRHSSNESHCYFHDAEGDNLFLCLLKAPMTQWILGECDCNGQLGHNH